MEFCPQCKSMIMLTGGMMKCRKCGFEKEKTKKIIEKKKFKEREITVLEGDEAAELPTIMVKCEEYGQM